LSNPSTVPSSSLPISNLQNLKISNSPLFDPGIPSSSRHSFSISKLSTMEPDFNDEVNVTMEVS
jgi:hypothetical protein